MHRDNLREFGHALMVAEPGLPTAEFAWAYLREYCDRHRRTGEPIHTLVKRIPNYISHVDNDEIRRVSTSPRASKHTTNLSRARFEALWNELRSTGSASYSANRFALALLCDAFPNLLEHAEGARLVTKRAPVFEFTRPEPFVSERRERDWRWPRYRTYSEGFDHWVTKHYIAEHPNEALEPLDAGPWDPDKIRLEVEFALPTADRVDVLAFDRNDVPTMIEVKPRVGPTNVEYYAQAAKYRAIWQVLSGAPRQFGRCVLAAASKSRTDLLERRMLQEYQIETVEVRVPEAYRAAMRPRYDQEFPAPSSLHEDEQG